MLNFLKTKQKVKSKVKERKFGCAKGLMVMHDDFDAPLDDFKEYMCYSKIQPFDFAKGPNRKSKISL